MVVEWVDVFTRSEYREIVVDSIKYCIANKGLMVHAWVIMSNHVHILISLDQNANNGLSDIMRDMKKYTAMHLIKVIRENGGESRNNWMLRLFLRAGKYKPNNTNFQLWRQDNHPIEITGERHFSETLYYLHENPVNAGWVDDALHYPWSSAKDFEGMEGLIPITFLGQLLQVKKTCICMVTSRFDLRLLPALKFVADIIPL